MLFFIFVDYSHCHTKGIFTDVVMAAVVEEVMYNGKLFCCYVKGDFGAEPVCQVA